MIRHSNAHDVQRCGALFQEVVTKEKFPTSWIKQAGAILEHGDVFLAFNTQGKPIGFFAYHITTIPDTGEKVLIERMLYVAEAYRRGRTAIKLIMEAERFATLQGCSAVLAGSSLNNNQAAVKLYDWLGYKTNYTFRKEL